MTAATSWPFHFVVNSADDCRFATFENGIRQIFGADAPPIVRIRDARSMCEGHNRGVRQGPRSEWYLFCHDDIRFLSPDAPALIRQAMEQCDMFGVAGTRRMVSGNWYDAGVPYTLGQVVARSAERRDRYELQIFGANTGLVQPGAVALDGILIACRAELFDRLGGFDEASYPWFVGYDMDFTFRAALAGARLAVSEALLLLHDSTVADFSEAKIKAWEDAQRTFVARFHGHLSAVAGARGHQTIPLATPEEGLRHIRRQPTSAAWAGTMSAREADPPRTRPQRTSARSAPEENAQAMKLACFTMFRNEAAILGPFLDQLTTFFDHAVLLNHGSTDGGPEMVAARGDDRLELLQLKAAGYPQSEVATGIAQRIFRTHAPDFLFFLDCDEFLPFADRAALESFLAPYRDRDGLTLRWQNVCPESLEGGDIFSGRFLRATAPSEYTKVVLGGRMAGRAGWKVLQGYHGVEPPPGEALDIAAVGDTPLLHIPVQSRTQFRFKIAAGARRIARSHALRAAGLGAHWISLDERAARGELDAEALRQLAICYPELPGAPVAAAPLDFSFPYVRHPYCETGATISGQIEGLLQMLDNPHGPTETGSFTVTDGSGSVLLSSGAAATMPAPSVAAGPVLPRSLFLGTFAEEYATLIEPLFHLPTKLPVTAWAGHIPFLFVLFRALRPATYVELGVHHGASLIAAATAARTYCLDTRCVGVDSWEGDDHAGRYTGDAIYRDLDAYVRGVFSNVTLMRCLFLEARKAFRPGSIDILHIDGLHTYDAVKEDFTTWFDLVSPRGVILFHDIAVFENGFGVHRLWSELKTHFRCMEFHHSHGLGVLFLDPEDGRIAPFRRLMEDPSAMRAYQSLVADVGGVIQERMSAFAQPAQAPQPPAHQELLAEKQALADMLEAMRNSTSWRVTAPMRAVRRMLGG